MDLRPPPIPWPTLDGFCSRSVLTLIYPRLTAVKVEGINNFADTLLLAGAILALAKAMPRTD